jgi:prophage maintenance system killer protein
MQFVVAAMAFKRVAFAGMDLYLRMSGYAIEADSKTIYEALMELVRNRFFATTRFAVDKREI